MEIYSKGIVAAVVPGGAQNVCGEHQQRRNPSGHWNRLFWAVVESSSLRGSKRCVDVAPGDPGQCWGMVGIDDLRGLFQP